MGHEHVVFGFPLWLRICHFLNFLLLSFLVRSGIQILADHPRLYWNRDSTPGSEWLKFTKKKLPTNELWTSLDDAVDISPWLAIPGGRHNLGIGRHWHFFAVIFWILTGLIYIYFLFTTENWPRLIPTSWDIIPRACHTLHNYCTFHLPPDSEFRPYDPLQQLAYAFVIFIMAPLTILTGAAMSPALVARHPWYAKLFGNRQIARSIHFLLMVAYLLFFIVHVSLVVLTGFSKNMNRIVFGNLTGPGHNAVIFGLIAIGLVILLNVFATLYSRWQPRIVQIFTGALIDNAMLLFFHKLTSRQQYKDSEISPYFWVNGRPPQTMGYPDLAANNFNDWRLEITGLIEKPQSFSLAELKQLPKRSQITMHNCIQGWSGIAQWAGVPLSVLMDNCQISEKTKYVIFHSFDIRDDGDEYYTSLDIEEARHKQVILAYEMNYKPLPVEYGAPLRLRAETKLGFKMCKFIRAIEFVEDYKAIGKGYGGYREDHEYYGTIASI